MPELPEVETARSLIADGALNRRIVDVDDSDTFVCRPHAPGELRDALTGRTLPAALKGTGAPSYVTGTTASQFDFRDTVRDRLPVIIGIVLVAAAFIIVANIVVDALYAVLDPRVRLG